MKHKFSYWIELKEGYLPTMEDIPETEINIIVSAKNRVTADRMIKAMLTAGNVKNIDCICID